MNSEDIYCQHMQKQYSPDPAHYRKPYRQRPLLLVKYPWLKSSPCPKISALPMKVQSNFQVNPAYIHNNDSQYIKETTS